MENCEMKRNHRSPKQGRLTSAKSHSVHRGSLAQVKNGRIALLEDALESRKGLIPAGEIQALENYWLCDPRWQGVTRTYSAEKVLRLRGTMKIEHTIADKMS